MTHRTTPHPNRTDAELSLIDFTTWPRRPEEGVVTAIAESSTECGMFRIRIPEDTAAALHDCLQAAQAFFSLDRTTKLRCHRPSHPFGYAVRGAEAYSEGDTGEQHLKEVFNIGPPYSPSTENVYPASPKGFQAAIERYYGAIEHLEQKLLGAFSSALAAVTGLDVPPSFLEQAKGRHRGLLRLNHYPSRHAGPAQNTFRDGTHTDWSLFTILFADNDGLEVFQSGLWRGVPTRPQEFVVNVGDQLHRISNGRFVSAYHRVRADKDIRKPRMSIVYFGAEAVDHSDGSIITPLRAPTDALRFDPFSIRDYVLSQFATLRS